MTKTEEFRLHNLFIKFRNEGWTKEKIINELEISNDIYSNWELEYSELTKTPSNFNNDILSSKLSGVNSEGEPLYKRTIQFKFSQLQKVIFDLQRIIQNSQDYETSQTEKIVESARKFLPIFNTYFIDIDFTIDEKEEKISVSYNLNIKDDNNDEIKKLAEEAAIFYGNYILSAEYHRSKMILIDSISKDIFSKAKNILPYALKTVEIREFNGISTISIRNVPIDTQWIFLIGENSFGKTTILQAITTGLYGEEDAGVFLLSRNNSKEYLVGVEYFSINKNSTLNNLGNNLKQLHHIACYGPSRLQIQTDQTQNDIEKKSATTYSLFNSDGILLNIEFELLLWYLDKKPKFESVKNVFLKLIPYLADIQVDVPQRRIYYIEKEPIENGEVYKPVRFEQLASGFRSIIAMVGDMMIRLFKSQPEIIEPSELAGIVIIDELDLHWHPKMQREIPNLLSAIFPKVQFIASTHSLVPLLGAPENSLLLKVNRTAEEGITVEKVDIDFKALSADTMLRDIFDLEKYMSDEKIKAWGRYRELKSLIRFEENAMLKESYLDEYEKLGDKYHFSV